MKNHKIQKNKGFTLVETMFAVYILTFTIVGLMAVVSSSLFAARYARDEITVNYLLQEVVDYVRNDRDTTVFLENGKTWDDFYNKYSNCSTGTGCYFDVLTNADTPKRCAVDGCPVLYYDASADNTPFYVEDTGLGMSASMLKTSFKRKIQIVQNSTNPDEIDVTVTIDWKNGSMNKTRTLQTSLMNWQK